jgi:hypothetical protein
VHLHCDISGDFKLIVLGFNKIFRKVIDKNVGKGCKKCKTDYYESFLPLTLIKMALRTP